MSEKNKEKLEFKSFDVLNSLIKVTNSRAWFALGSVLFLVGMIVIWLFYGGISTKIDGFGILINPQGIESVTANANGKIISFEVKVGEWIKKDHPVATILQPELLSEIKIQQEKIKEQEAIIQKEKLAGEQLENEYKDILSTLKKRIDPQKEKDNLETKEKITEIKQKIEDIKTEILKKEYSLNDLKRALEAMNEKYERESYVRSSQNGIILEIEQAVGDFVSSGDTLLTMETNVESKRTLKGVIYVSALEAKKIFPGMKVLLVPSIINPEEYGLLKGKVESVSSYPATQKGVMRILHNEEITKQILNRGNQIQVNVELVKNKKYYSGYEWTSENGPPIKLQSGTLCDAKIIVDSKRPIELVFPKIRYLVNTDNE